MDFSSKTKSGKGNKNKGFFLETNQRGVLEGGNGAILRGRGHLGARYPGYWVAKLRYHTRHYIYGRGREWIFYQI